jgi:hypothetical protein
VPTEYTPPDNNGHDDLREVAYLPHHVRGLQNEVATVVDECLQELDCVCELLWTCEKPSAAAAANSLELLQPADLPRETGSAAAVASASAPPAGPAYAKTESTTDFDARLANLKRLLAEKLHENDKTN